MFFLCFFTQILINIFMFFNDFYIISPAHFLYGLGKFIFHILLFFRVLVFSWTVAHTYSTAWIIWFSYIHLFQKTQNSTKCHFGNYQNPCRFQNHFIYFFIVSMTCSASILVSICSLNLNGKSLPKRTKKHSKKLGFFHVKTSFRAPVTPVSPRDVISSPKGTPKWPTGVPGTPFWLPSAPFWIPFGSLLGPFGFLLARFGSLLLTSGLHFLILDVSRRHFGSLSCNSIHKFINKYFLDNFLQKSPCWTPKSHYSAKFRTHLSKKKIIFRIPPIQFPGAEQLTLAT